MGGTALWTRCGGGQAQGTGIENSWEGGVEGTCIWVWIVCGVCEVIRCEWCIWYLVSHSIPHPTSHPGTESSLVVYVQHHREDSVRVSNPIMYYVPPHVT